MLLGGISDPGNKAMLKMFNLVDVGERVGSGVPNIYNVWEDEGWVTARRTLEKMQKKDIIKLANGDRYAKYTLI